MKPISKGPFPKLLLRALHRIGELAFSSPMIVIVALIVVASAFIPWRLAQPAVYNGFDKNLMFVSDKGTGVTNGTVAIDRSRALITARGGSRPRLDLVTSKDSFSADFDVKVSEPKSPSRDVNLPTTPIGVRLWYPSRGDTVGVRFTGGQDHRIVASFGSAGLDSRLQTLGTYELDSTYHVHVDLVRNRTASFRVGMPNGTSSSFGVNASTGFGLFSGPDVNLTLDAAAPLGSEAVTEVRNFRLTVPPVMTFGVKTSDWRLSALVVLILGWFGSYALVRTLKGRRGSIRRAFATSKRIRPRVIALAMVAIIGSLLLFTPFALADGLPFDRVAQETWSYVADQYGVDNLYSRSNVVPDTPARGGGASWSDVAFAYSPGMAYVYAFFGKTWHAFRGPVAPMHDRWFHAFWKLGFAVFILADAILLAYFLVRVMGMRLRWAVIVGLSLFVNPAMVFDSAVWGESEPLLCAALLISVIGFARNRSRLGWSALVIAILLKQSALFAAPILAVFAFRRFGYRRTIVDASFSAVVGFAFISPLILAGYHPVTAFLALASQIGLFGFHAGNAVSGDTFSMWTLLSDHRGLHGFDRLLPPFPITLPGTSVGISIPALILLLLVVAVAAWAVWRTAKTDDSMQTAFLSIALVIIAYVTLSPKGSARYLLLGLPFLMLSLGRPPSIERLASICAVTVISLLSMYGIFMVIAVRGDWPYFNVLGNPATNAISNAFYRIYTSDIAITLLAGVLLFLTLSLLMEVTVTALRARSAARPMFAHSGGPPSTALSVLGSPRATGEGR